MAVLDIPIYASDLKRLLNITSTAALRNQIKSGKVPPPDVRNTQKTRYWHRSTLERIGLLQPIDQSQSPQA